MYFFDTGLVAYLTKYTSPEILENGAINGAILENYVVSEIRKTYQNEIDECLLWYYRDKDSNEVDMVIECNGMVHPIPRGKGAIICMRPEMSAVDSDNYIVPVWMI